MIDEYDLDSKIQVWIDRLLPHSDPSKLDQELVNRYLSQALILRHKREVLKLSKERFERMYGISASGAQSEIRQ